MNKDRMNYFKEMLIKEREKVIATINMEDENGANAFFQDYFNELSVYDNHPGDIGSELYEFEMTQNLKSHEKRILNEIDNALSKFSKNLYGICEKCGREIEEERLEAIPYTRFCINCKDEKINEGDINGSRPIEEEILHPPFGKSFNDKEDTVIFDGEDSWQEVARFNKTDYKKMALDWYDNNMYDKNIPGVTEDIDDISDEYYREKMTDADKEEK